MSAMDGWGRPSRSQPIPAPYYLLPGGDEMPYCHSCGRVVSTRRTSAAAERKVPAKYCSSRCRAQRPGKLDRQLEAAFVKFLSGGEVFEGARPRKGKHAKGESRILVPCSAVEKDVFGVEDTGPTEEAKSDAESDVEEDGAAETGSIAAPPSKEVFERFYDEGVAGIPVHDPGESREGENVKGPHLDQSTSGVHARTGAEKGRPERVEETEAMLEKRKEGQRKARRKEMTKCAARRGVVFGFVVGNGEGAEDRRFCEAVMGGKVVEPSFAKGDWAIRWRE